MTNQPSPSPAADSGSFIDDPSRLRKVFLAVAALEALSWVGLLVGVYLKRVAETTEVGVQVFGPIHGGVFVAYVVISIIASRKFGWSLGTTALALFCSIPPFFSVVFEVVADRKGLLQPATARPATA
ncbi:DUF3817 domain-containing protein [Aeromicrobium sp. Root495]|uniref:DUF3817 domain-containing protein n=1 Tax=Aeromicrobium sp. Root495 TaxID=1736550 RepID=UPI000A74E48D|nr:DUF3817 domain-containing protein [Aeromicrobium sp. Root495]